MLREGPAVFLIPKDLTQSTIVMAGPGGVSQGTGRDYFASRIGNSILGTGGFSSRLLSRVRTDMGYAYSASSFWTTPSRSQGIVGATTQTKSESTVAVVELMLEIISEMGEEPPDKGGGRQGHLSDREQLRFQLPGPLSDRLPADVLPLTGPSGGLARTVSSEGSSG